MVVDRLSFLPILRVLIVLSNQLNASAFFRKFEAEAEGKEFFGIDMFKAGESSPAIASLLPRMMSAGLKAGGDRGEVS